MAIDGYRGSRRSAWIAVHALGLVACLTACTSTQSSTSSVPSALEKTEPKPLNILFTELKGPSAVPFTYRNDQEANHCSILESLGGGIGVVDFDRDGWNDLCMAGGGEFTSDLKLVGLPTGLFRNLGNSRFQTVGDNARISPSKYYSHGVAVADYDNDGFADILITGYGGVLLWMNLGDGTYIESATESGITANRWASSASWADLNGDAFLDLYIANYVNWSFENHPECMISATIREICSPKSFDPVPHYVFFSNGDGSFVDGSEAAGLRKDGKGLGVIAADLDNDGDVDLYVANDTTPNFLYLNDGQGHLEENGLLRGAALDDQGISNGSMGVDICDFNNDGLPDIWVANYEHETFALYRNEGQGYFLHVSQAAGVTALGQLFVGFGTACADFDRDGDEDIMVSNGHVIKYPKAAPRRQVPVYLENRQGRFYRTTFPDGNYFATGHEGRGVATTDWDNDGDLDLVVSHLNDPASLLRNDCQLGKWLAIELVGSDSNRDAIGARLRLVTDQGEFIRQIKGGGSYLCTNGHRVYWGLPRDAVATRLLIDWPSGKQQAIESPTMNRVSQIIEPRRTDQK